MPCSDHVTPADGSTIRSIGTTTCSLHIEGIGSMDTGHIITMTHDTLVLTLGKACCCVPRPHIDWKDLSIRRTRDYCATVLTMPRHIPFGTVEPSIKNSYFKKMVRTVKKVDCDLLTVRMQDSDNSYDINPVFQRDISFARFMDVVNAFFDVFRDAFPEFLPSKRVFKLEICTISGDSVPEQPVILLAPNYLKDLRHQLYYLLRKGQFRPSSSPYGTPVFFFKIKMGIFVWFVLIGDSMELQSGIATRFH